MKRLMSSLAVAVALAVSSNATAVTLVPSTNTPLPGTTVADEPQLAGTVLEDWVQPFSFEGEEGVISGTVQSRVVRSSTDGTLDFYWRVQNDATSLGSIVALRLGGFLANAYNANYRIDGVGTNAPNYARLFADDQGNVNFVFNQAATALDAGESTYFLLLDTDATNYALGGRYDVVGGNTFTNSFETFIPAPVPEPTTYAMLALGLAAIAYKRRGKR